MRSFVVCFRPDSREKCGIRQQVRAARRRRGGPRRRRARRQTSAGYHTLKKGTKQDAPSYRSADPASGEQTCPLESRKRVRSTRVYRE